MEQTVALLEAECRPDPIHWLREDVLLALLNIPQNGILGVSSALLFTSDQVAYWWRDAERDQQHVKLVSPQALRAAIGGIPIDSGYLPERVLRLGISPKGLQWMLVYRLPHVYRLSIERKEQERISIELGLPGCLFFGLGDTYFLWAIKDNPKAGETALYRFPLPNIGEDGRMCFGTNQPPRVSWPWILPAFSLFFDSPFNGHWAWGKSRLYPGDIRERLLALASEPGAWFQIGRAHV